MPRDEERVHFAADIQPLFREKDRQSMLRHFDLGSYEDVSEHADRILDDCAAAPCPAMAPGRLGAEDPSTALSAAPLEPDQVR